MLEVPVFLLPSFLLRWRVLEPMLFQSKGTIGRTRFVMHAHSESTHAHTPHTHSESTHARTLMQSLLSWRFSEDGRSISAGDSTTAGASSSSPFLHPNRFSSTLSSSLPLLLLSSSPRPHSFPSVRPPDFLPSAACSPSAAVTVRVSAGPSACSGGGFCPIADISIAIHSLRKNHNIRRVLIVDLVRCIMLLRMACTRVCVETFPYVNRTRIRETATRGISWMILISSSLTLLTRPSIQVCNSLISSTHPSSQLSHSSSSSPLIPSPTPSDLYSSISLPLHTLHPTPSLHVFYRFPYFHFLSQVTSCCRGLIRGGSDSCPDPLQARGQRGNLPS